jgi:hypothetical protein
MTQIQLTEIETTMLKEILEKHLSEMTFETAFSHSKESIEFLQKRKKFIEGLIERLRSGERP